MSNYNQRHVVANTAEETERLVTEFEIQSVTKFTIFRRNKGFSSDHGGIMNHKVHWEDMGREEGIQIPYSGMPYVVLGYDVRECHFGPDRNVAIKKRYKMKKNQETDQDHQYIQKTRTLVQNTKKMNCPARIYMKKICKFPDYKILGHDSSWKRKNQAKKLKQALSENHEVSREIEFHLLFPEKESHRNHLTGQLAGICLPVDNSIKEKISCLMNEGVMKVSEMKQHIKSFSRKELKMTDEENRRFFPLDKDIRNIMEYNKGQTRFSNNDKENLKDIIDNLKASNEKDSFHLDISGTEEFLFVGQTESQKRLLKMYGQEICLLDATYKTTKFNLPAFFVCVNTNVGYSTVGCFITADETKASIKRGLQYLRKWNENWNPQFFMTDFDQSEIGALEETFPGCHVYLCDFHREQAWDRWLKTQSNGCTEYKDEILSMLREIAKSTTESQFQKSVDALKCSTIWKNKLRLQQWFERVWLAHYKRWVSLFRLNMFNIRVTTTNGLERQHLKLKQDYLANTSDKSLSNLINVLFTQVFPDSQTRYIEYNTRSLDCFKAYSSKIPRFLKNKPRMLVEHCVKRIPPNAQPIPQENIRERSAGKFQVKSVDSGNVYDINLSAQSPCCSCVDWQKYHLPCKHMLAVFQHFPSWDWDFLPSEYRDSPHFNLDFEILDSLQIPTPSCETVAESFKQQVLSNKIPKAKLQNTSLSSSTVKEHSNKKDWLKCRELVKTIQSSLMNLCGLDLGNLVQQLQQVAYEMKNREPKDDNLPILKPPRRQKLANSRSSKSGKRKLLDLPLPQKKKQRRLKATDFIKSPTRGTVHNKIGEEDQKAKTTNISLKDVCTPSETDVHMSEEYQDLTTTAKDEIQLQKEVNKIWDQAERTGYVMARCGDTNLTDEDIISLKGNNWLTDQVVDACLGAIAEAETDKGNRVYKMVTSTMTSILDGHCLQKMHLRDVQLHDYEVIIGAYFQEMGHWDLVVIEPMTRTILFYNPLGETLPQKVHIQENWSHFFNRRISLGLEVGKSEEKWTLKTVPHTKQLDGHNCGVYIILFCERYFTKESILNISSEELRNTRMRLANKLLMYQVYIKDNCPACGFQMKERQNKITCRQCDRKFHMLPHCVGESLQGDDFEHFTCRQCLACVRETMSEDSVTMKVCQAKNVNQMHSTDIQEDREPFDITEPRVNAVLKSNFSEQACENLVDTMQYYGWISNSKTAQKVIEKLPVIPNQLQTRFQGRQCIGVFGDGYINELPSSVRRNKMFPLATHCSASESLFASVSILIWGDIKKMQLLRLAVLCYEILHYQEKHAMKSLIWLEMSSRSKNDNEVLREMHLNALASITKRKITVYASSGTKSYFCENKGVSTCLPLLELTLHGEENISYLPLVDGFLVGRGHRFFDRCGAMEFGLCHGDFGEKITCSVCGQKYHVHCVDVYEEPLECGCHLLMPFQFKNEAFYKSNAEMKEIIRKIDLQEFLRSIKSGRRPSLRKKIFSGTNTGHMQKQKEKQIHAVALSEEMITFIINSTRKIINCPFNHAMDIYLPEVLIKIIQYNENANRLLAELLMQQL